MFLNTAYESAPISRWSLPERAILHGACFLILGFFVFCGVSLSRVEQASSLDLFVNPAAASLALDSPKD